MKMNKKGFTLTEILLAVMIVGLIGVALAALTTAASRESGVGRSKVMLRNNLSLALRTLRSDINSARQIDLVAGTSIPTAGPLLQLKNTGNTYITYCFKAGTIETNREGKAILPAGAKIGGSLYRVLNTGTYGSCSIATSSGTCCASCNCRKLLDDVKYIPSGSYPVPLFCLGNNCHAGSNLGTSGILTVRLITELYSRPVVNEAVEEMFITPGGF